MRAKWGVFFFLSILSSSALASPVASTDKPRSPFSVDRQPAADSVEERANISTNRILYSLTLNESSLLSQEVKTGLRSRVISFCGKVIKIILYIKM